MMYSVINESVKDPDGSYYSDSEDDGLDTTNNYIERHIIIDDGILSLILPLSCGVHFVARVLC